MASRPPVRSPRRSKSARKSPQGSIAEPVAASARADSDAARPDATSNEASGGSEVRLTGASLERRQIPSFSLSREARIAEAAYWRAERRGFAAGHELDDWLAAEEEIDSELARERPEVRREQGELE